MLGYYGYTMFLTYLNLLSGLAGMYLALTDNVGYAFLCLAIAGVCDLFDGIVARTKRNRTETEKGYGIQVDSLADIVSFGILPAVIGFAMGFTEWWHLTIMAVYILFALIRLAFYNTTEVELQKQGIKRTHFTGLPVTTAAILYPLLYLFVDFERYPLVYIITMLVMALLFVLKIRVAKFRADDAFMRFLYTTSFGRVILKLLVKVFVSRLAGWFLSTSFSRAFIEGFIRSNDIDMSEYKQADFQSFNDFFTRQIADGCRPFADDPNDLPAPSDGKLSAYRITAESYFNIKKSIYDVHALLQDEALANEYIGGTCLIFRLTPDDYHRYSFIDNGEILSHKKIRGVFHTVRPFAVKSTKVYLHNAREYTVMQTEHFDKVIQIEIGAMFVGKISNLKTSGTFVRGEEKGMFEFGGSTVMLLFKKDCVKIDDDIFEVTECENETVVRMGSAIGTIALR